MSRLATLTTVVNKYPDLTRFNYDSLSGFKNVRRKAFPARMVAPERS